MLILFSNFHSSETQYRDTYPKEYVLIFPSYTISKQKTELEEKNSVAIAYAAVIIGVLATSLCMSMWYPVVSIVYMLQHIQNQIHEMLTRLLWLSVSSSLVFLNHYTILSYILNFFFLSSSSYRQLGTSYFFRIISLIRLYTYTLVRMKSILFLPGEDNRQSPNGLTQQYRRLAQTQAGRGNAAHDFQ